MACYEITRKADGSTFTLETNPEDRPSFAIADGKCIPLTFENANQVLTDAFVNEKLYSVREIHP